MVCTLAVIKDLECISPGIDILGCTSPGFGVFTLFVAVVLVPDCATVLTVGSDVGLTGSFVVLSVSLCLPCSSGLEFWRSSNSSGDCIDAEDIGDIFVVDS